ncbi:SDR family oxidoreductase [Temperatibacter marinus]|uniref:SDR family oxidoreductase n=1 Tax=Temperatibacter marinus TaxID=1456591 RepID=A0AA52EEW3_9PROT|nr:SDR family oxidoreductase [Temperatibacter marinus]WND03526.1 SDR family oxidoreductase [Temperatibacter marinus]
MKSVVITGSTKGIGRGLAENFLKRGCKVLINGRQAEDVDALAASLSERYGADHVAGCPGDITKAKDLQKLWDTCTKTFGQVDIWINNAGMGMQRGPLYEASPSAIKKIVDVNVTGILLANAVVSKQMLAQGYGQIWNMEGFGSGGQMQQGMTAYGATKRAVNYVNGAMQKDLKDTQIQVCTLSPGIVVTELLMGDYDLKSPEWEKAKKIFNILGDKVETVTPYLVDGILKTKKSGAKVAWLTGGKAFARFMTAAFKKRDLFSDQAS